jgi:hypothetical protein
VSSHSVGETTLLRTIAAFFLSLKILDRQRTAIPTKVAIEATIAAYKSYRSFFIDILAA